MKRIGKNSMNILSKEEVIEKRKSLQEQGLKVVFTNGCFDILHAGHVDYLGKAKAFGDALIVGINSDDSIKRIKGPKRPILPENERAILVSSLKSVDYVTIFNEDTPKEIISLLKPDVLVKGADWSLDTIVGKKEVEEAGGEVRRVQFSCNSSTSGIIKTILARYKE